MANYRKDFYDMDPEEQRYSSTPVQKKRTAQTARNTSRAEVDTDAISRNLESSADEHIQRNRRVPAADGYNRPAAPQKRKAAPRRNASAMNDPSYEEAREEMYRKKRQARAEVAKWKRAHWIVRFLIVFVLILDVLILRFGVFKGGFLPVWNVLTHGSKHETAQPAEGFQISEQLLTVNEFSRPGSPLDAVNGIVIHYTGMPGTDSQANRDYFENLKDGTEKKYGSCNYIVGIDGSVIHCVPDNEVAYASAGRNTDTLSIEYCHLDDSGAMTPETFQSLVQLTAKLCKEHNLTTDQIIRHYDVNGTPCPRYFVDDPDSWSNFINSVAASMG